MLASRFKRAVSLKSRRYPPRLQRLLGDSALPGMVARRSPLIWSRQLGPFSFQLHVPVILRDPAQHFHVSKEAFRVPRQSDLASHII